MCAANQAKTIYFRCRLVPPEPVSQPSTISPRVPARRDIEKISFRCVLVRFPENPQFSIGNPQLMRYVFHLCSIRG